ncbi:major facilitator superfamily domain-containing protein [Melanogaster broomeanus]|nr:major facilitator superfamily domain-containing protein [Melanogaster broomeanus]
MSESTSPTGTSATIESSAVDAAPTTECHRQHCQQTYQLPPLRYDPEKPFHFGILLNASFGISSTMGEVSKPTLVQAGFGIGLLCVAPLGDMVRRRGLILVLVFSSTCLTIGLAITKNIYAFEVISFLIGFTSVTPQILMPLAADLAPPHRRASAISIVLSGVLMGILIARVLSGVVANFVSWRNVYVMSIGIQSVVLFGSYFMLPDYPGQKSRPFIFRDDSFHGQIYADRTTGHSNRADQHCCECMLYKLLGDLDLLAWWTAILLLYVSFGLFGILGVVVVPFMGRLVDKVPPWHVAIASTMLLIVFQAVQTAAGGINVAAVVITCFGLDVSRQTQQVALSTLIYG